MSRYTRNTVIQALIEPSYATNDALVWGAADALLIKDPDFKIDRDVVPRELVRGHMGGSEHLIGTRRAEITFSVELAGSGAAGTAPAWGKLLRGCGMAEVITAGQRVEYNPVTTGHESLTFRFFRDGVRYTAKGARGTVAIRMPAYEAPVLDFTFWGFDTFAAEATPGTPNFAAWQRPLVITDANAGDVLVGATLATGVVSGGTALASRGFTADLKNELSHVKLLRGEAIDIKDRDASGSITVALTTAQEVSWRNDINSNVLTTLGFNIGSTAGQRVSVFCPSVQRVAPQAVDYEGRVMMQSELRILPSAGNDELRIIAR